MLYAASSCPYEKLNMAERKSAMAPWSKSEAAKVLLGNGASGTVPLSQVSSAAGTRCQRFSTTKGPVGTPSGSSLVPLGWRRGTSRA